MRCTALDLFCGAGGLSLGLLRAGVSVLAGVDSSAPAVATYRSNFRHPALKVDVAKLDAAQLSSLVGIQPGKLDLVAGGPPCQGFSVQRIGSDLDERNSLVLEFGRLVLELQPRAFLMENVAGLLGTRGRLLFRSLVSMLSKGGYEVAATILDAADFGVPQRRRRVFVYGWRRGSVPLTLPSCDPHTEERTVWDAICDLPEPALTADGASDPLHVESKMSPLNRERLKLIPPGGGFEHLPVDLRVACHRDGPSRIGHRYVYGRLSADEPAATITARFDSFTRGKFAHPYRDRNITLREGARLQTFPDDFVFTGNRAEVAALIGNAVPPVLAQKVVAALLAQISGASEPVTHNDPAKLF